MSKDDEIKKVLEDFIAHASTEEVTEFMQLLEERNKKQSGLGKINVNDIASSFAKNIQKQIGITNSNMKKMAKDLVIKLARQHSPNITDKELSILVNEMVPGSIEKKLPPDLLMLMIYQFVSYNIGTMPDFIRNDLPDNWQEKYWSHFPGKIKKLINAYMQNKVDADMFWKSVRIFLRKKA